MRKYDEKCPVCGTVNHDLFLDETNGWMECENCRMLIRSVRYVDSLRMRPAAEHEYLQAATA